MSACIQEELVTTKQEMPEIQENQVPPNRIQLNIKTNKTENEASANLLLDTTIVKTENNEKLLGINIFSDYSSGFIKTEEVFVKDGILDMIEEEDEEEGDAVDVGVESQDNKTVSDNEKMGRRKEEVRKVHGSVLKLKKLYPKVSIPNSLYSFDLDPFVSLSAPFKDRHCNLAGGYQNERESNENGNKSTVINYLTLESVKTEVEGNAKVFQSEFEPHLTVVYLNETHAEENEEADTGRNQFVAGNLVIKTEEEEEEEIKIKDECNSEGEEEGEEIEVKKEECNAEGEREKVYSCEECQRQFEQYGCIVKRHLAVVPSSYSCKECQKQFSRKHYLAAHVKRVHERIKPYSCEECRKQFSEKYILKDHMIAVHSGENPYNCKECQKRFGQKSSLKAHIKSVHKGIKPYSCKECPKNFSQISILKRHVSSVHSCVKSYGCTECPKKFSEKSKLEEHTTIVHRGIKPYCKMCDKHFSWKSGLKMHMINVHSNAKPYSCNECEKKFAAKCNLNRHIMMHAMGSSVKSYNCNECQRKFAEKRYLNRHMMNIHSNVKPYSCNECQKKFGDKGILKLHMMTIHSSEKPYSCNECQKQFGQKGTLKRHMNTVHSGIKSESSNDC